MKQYSLLVPIVLVVATLLAGCVVSEASEPEEPECSSLTEAQWESIDYMTTMQELDSLPKDTKRIGIDDLGDEVAPKLLDFPNLEALALMSSTGERNATSSYAISDEGMADLAESDSIKHLLVAYASITDSALDVLVRMKNLCELRLVYCAHVTESGVQRFRDARPNVELHVQYLPQPD